VFYKRLEKQVKIDIVSILPYFQERDDGQEDPSELEKKEEHGERSRSSKMYDSR